VPGCRPPPRPRGAAPPQATERPGLDRVATLDPRDREALFTIMDAVLTKQRMKQVLEATAEDAG